MKKRWYKKSGLKGLMVCLTIVALVVGCVCGGASILLMSKGIRPLDSRKHVDSERFTENMYETSHTILEALGETEILNESSKEDLVDLTELKEGKSLSNKNTSGLAYKAGDLTEWSKGSWDRSVNVLICRRPDSSDYYMYYNDFADKIISGELKFVWGSDEEKLSQEYTKDILSMLSGEEYAYYDDGYNYSGIRMDDVEYVEDADGNVVYTNIWNYEPSGNNDAALKEEYKPDGADSILDIVNNNKEWNGNLQKAYQYLYAALVKYNNAVDSKDVLDAYAQGNTNYKYLYVDTKTKKVYSNIKSVTFSNYKKIMTDIVDSNEAFMVIEPKQQDCMVGMENTLDQTLAYWQQMIENSGPAGENYIYCISADSAFPVLDYVAQEKTYYDKFEPWIMPLLILTGVGFILALIGLVILTIAAGKTNKDQEVHLNFFDRWYTEIAALLVFGIWIYGVAIMMQMMDSGDMRMAGYLVGMGILGIWSGAWFLMGWLSLVRRIKARSIWRDSVLRHVLLFIRKIFSKFADMIVFLSNNTVSRIKTIVAFGVFVFLLFMATGLFVGADIPFFLLVFVVTCWVALYYLLKKAWGREQILDGLKKITDGDLQYKIPTEKLFGEQKKIADYINHIGEGLDAAVENSLKNERMKTELITNVSHDIKTPLTSIINYIDLLKRENPEDPKIRGYLDVLENKAQRLKVLTEDVVEASKASTGNISLEMTELNFVELVNQVIGEFEEKFEERNLKMVVHFDEEEAIICADGRRLWRVLENVFGNVSKYAMENTRVYVDVKVDRPNVQLSLKNISAQPLNISADELTERFIRGDVSRNTEGSGLGLSIAKDLVQLQGGEFRLYLDGDLFKVTIEFKMK